MTPHDICKMATNGNKDAETFCVTWVNACHAIDNCEDKDKAMSDEQLTKAIAEFTMAVAGNPFFLTHKPQLMSLMIQSMNAWLDSNKRQGIERHVLAGMYHEVVYFCAFLTGGWTHLRHVTTECREYKGVPSGSV